MDLTQHAWAERHYLLDGTQKRALLQALAAEPGAQHVTQRQHCLYFDTPDAAILRAIRTGEGFAQVLLLQAGQGSLCGDSLVSLQLYRRAGQRWTCLQSDLCLRDVELFLRAGILPHETACMAALRLAHAFRLRTGARPVLVAASTRHTLTCARDKSVRLYVEEDLRARRMALSLEAGAFGERVLNPGDSLLRIRVDQAVPIWLSDLLHSLHILHAWTPGTMHEEEPSSKGVLL